MTSPQSWSVQRGARVTQERRTIHRRGVQQVSVTIDQLCSAERTSSLVKVSAWIAYHVARERIGSIAEMARRFNEMNRVSAKA
jgi:hypothetical protein